MIESRNGSIYISAEAGPHICEVANRLNETDPELLQEAGGLVIVSAVLDTKAGIVARGGNIPVSAAELLIDQAQREINAYEAQRTETSGSIFKKIGRKVLHAVSGPPNHIVASEQILPKLESAVEEAKAPKPKKVRENSRRLKVKDIAGPLDEWQIAEEARRDRGGYSGKSARTEPIY